MDPVDKVLPVEGRCKAQTNENNDQLSQAMVSDTSTLDTPGNDPTHHLVTQPFQSVLDTLDKLERDDPKLASQAARLVGLLRRVWESCITKQGDVQGLENANAALRAETVKLSQEGCLRNREEEQAAHLASFHEGMEQARAQLLEALKNWNMIMSEEVRLASHELPTDQ